MSDAPTLSADGSIIITFAQLYSEMQKDLGAIRASLDEQKVTLSGVPAMLADHEQRIRLLERARWTIAGAAAAAGTVAGAFAAKIVGG